MIKSAREILKMVGKNVNTKVVKIGKLNKYTAYEITQNNGQYLNHQKYHLTIFKCNEDFTRILPSESDYLSNVSYDDCIKHLEKVKEKYKLQSKTAC